MVIGWGGGLSAKDFIIGPNVTIVTRDVTNNEEVEHDVK
jgi:hypothetical protein